MTNLLVHRKIEIASVDSPYLVRYYLAREFCMTGKSMDCRHLIRTYSLSSRFEFDCLDSFNRHKNVKMLKRTPKTSSEDCNDSLATPRRHLDGNNSSTSNQATVTGQSTNSNKRSNTKRSRIIAACDHCNNDHWTDDEVLCRYCDKLLDIKEVVTGTEREFHLHLIFFLFVQLFLEVNLYRRMPGLRRVIE